MWQKLNRIDTFELRKAITQLINAARLVNAADVSFASGNADNQSLHLRWDVETSSLSSGVFGVEEKIKVSLDTERFVLSIFGNEDHIEHLVLSGITYPMAFGWMSVKLDAFGVNGEHFNDLVPYSIANPLGSNDELYVTDPQTFTDLSLYFSNAYQLLHQVKKRRRTDAEVTVDPANLRMILPEKKGRLVFGFSPGSDDLAEPYFFIESESSEKLADDRNLYIRFPVGKSKTDIAFPSSAFLNTDAGAEEQSVLDFFSHHADVP